MGVLTADFLKRGFTGVCYDLGDESRVSLRSNLAPFGSRVEVVESLAALPAGSFDYVFAFEVLEHIEADTDALRSWVAFLKPSGRILISVPAHMRKYGDEDRSVGHYRRYERQALAHLFEAAGCTDARVVSYGFPTAIVTRRANRLLSHWKAGAHSVSASERQRLSIRSGVERSEASVQWAALLNRHTLRPFIALQRMFFGTDLGDGYVAHAARAG
jgi:SAM-dependent methyltransferase